VDGRLGGGLRILHALHGDHVPHRLGQVLLLSKEKKLQKWKKKYGVLKGINFD
jgi:hypothetical protein